MPQDSLKNTPPRRHRQPSFSGGHPLRVRPLAALTCGLALTVSALAALSQVLPHAQAAIDLSRPATRTASSIAAAVQQPAPETVQLAASTQTPDPATVTAAAQTLTSNLLRNEPAAAQAIPSQPAAPAQPALRPIAKPAQKATANARTLWMEVTAYCACTHCCGKDARGVTASGKTVRHNRGRFVAADTKVLPFGTKLSIPGYHNAAPVEVIDRGGDIKGNRLDVFFPSHKTAQEFGRRWVKVTVTPK